MCNDTEAEYFRWCESMVIKIYYSNIAMRDDLIKEVVAEIASKLHYTEGKQTMRDDLIKEVVAEIASKLHYTEGKQTMSENL